MAAASTDITTRDTVRFGVQLDRESDQAFAAIAEDVERRSKVDLHRAVIHRIVQLWKERPEALEELGIIRRGY